MFPDLGDNLEKGAEEREEVGPKAEAVPQLGLEHRRRL